MAQQNPVVVVPGITGSALRDEYPLDAERVWGALPFQKKWERVALHPDDLRYEREAPARVSPDGLLGVAYAELVAELRHDLSPRADRPTPVFPFAYDWRQPLARLEGQLEAFVREVIERTRLLRHYAEGDWAGKPRVDLVGHSMGGLVIAGYLQRLGGEAPVDRVVSIASPFRGSFEAVLKITTGLAELGEARPLSREREIARLTPSLYHLLPTVAGGLLVDEGLPPSGLPDDLRLYDPATWQPSVLQTLGEYVRLHAARRGARREQARELFEALLGEAREHRARLESLDLGEVRLAGGADGWLCLVGVGAETRVALRVRSERGRPRFDLRSAERCNEWGAEQGDRTRTGDGTVPYAGACSAFVPVEKIVCLSPDDFGYWEWKDRVLERVAGFHGMLPTMNLVQRLVVAHLKGESGRGLRARRPPDLPPGARWAPPLAGLAARE